MKIPRPPWYDSLEKKLGSVEWLVDAVLVGIILIALYLLLFGGRVPKTLFATYMISP